VSSDQDAPAMLIPEAPRSGSWQRTGLQEVTNDRQTSPWRTSGPWTSPATSLRGSSPCHRRRTARADRLPGKSVKKVSSLIFGTRLASPIRILRRHS
jgi:hypothetical protein